MASAFNPTQPAARWPLYDINPLTAVSFEVFYTDRTLETFGRGGAGWFWWPRQRGFAPDGAARGPYPTAYCAYRAAANGCEPAFLFGRRSTTCASPPIPQRKCGHSADTMVQA
jgi:hypothetical protein